VEIDPAEFTKNSAEILRVSSQLRDLRTQRDELNKKISELEKELMPYLTKQAEMTAALVGAAVPVPVPVAQPVTTGAAAPASSGSNTSLKQKIMEFLSKCDEDVSAMDVAEVLHIDPAIVREAMLDLKRR
jgi:hypothetical protein